MIFFHLLFFLKEIKKDYQNCDFQLYTALNKFAKCYNMIELASIFQLSSFFYDLNYDLDSIAYIKSGAYICVQVESVKKCKMEGDDTK